MNELEDEDNGRTCGCIAFILIAALASIPFIFWWVHDSGVIHPG